VLEGPTLVAEAVTAGTELEVVLVEEGAEAPEGTDPTFVAAGVLGKVLDTVTPRPVAAVAVLAPARVEDLVGAALAAARPIVVLDRVGDPGNAGTILRAAEASGAVGAVFTEGSVDPWAPKTVRSSAGSVLRLPVALGALGELRRPDLELLGAAGDAEISHLDADLAGAVAIVVGNEAHGLDADAVVDRRVRIDMEGPTESLNVAMAATVLLFEAMRQRRERR
jgi:TrmH family RNA methyltransferase